MYGQPANDHVIMDGQPANDHVIMYGQPANPHVIMYGQPASNHVIMYSQPANDHVIAMAGVALSWQEKTNFTEVSSKYFKYVWTTYEVGYILI